MKKASEFAYKEKEESNKQKTFHSQFVHFDRRRVELICLIYFLPRCIRRTQRQWHGQNEDIFHTNKMTMTQGRRSENKSSMHNAKYSSQVTENPPLDDNIDYNREK